MTLFTLVVPPIFVVILVKAVLAPAAALKVVAPVLIRLRAKPPSTAPVKVIAPEPASMVVSSAKVVVLAAVNAALVNV